ncbi:carbonic anhydrase [Amylibacter sp.]|nr:carbonic anhydrase [Amylibacter sp.]
MTNPASPLPSSLISRYHGWRATSFQENKAWYARLAEGGQHPRTMIISCCDSRVHATTIFGADTGDFFIHRNIANLVPPYAPNEDYHGTSAAVEYAVTALGVTNLIVMGHSLCGGIQGCHDMCSGKAPELEKKTSFVGRWMDILRPTYEKVAKEGGTDEEQVKRLEHEGVLTSIENLMSFPFVSERVNAEELALHAVILDISDGTLEQFDQLSNSFNPI